MPSGLRMGYFYEIINFQRTVPMTSRGLKEDDFAQIVDYIERGTKIA